MDRLAEARILAEDEDDNQRHVVEVMRAAVRRVIQQLQ